MDPTLALSCRPLLHPGRPDEANAPGEVAEPLTRLPLGGEPPETLDAIPGQPPRPEAWPSGCRFHPRCELWKSLGEPEICVNEDPRPDEDAAHWAACHFAGQHAGLRAREGKR